jgi:hypothetical protein
MTAEEFLNSIEVGTVYYFSDLNIKSGEPHYNVILNKNPKSESFIIFVPATTLDIWSAQSAQKFPRETIVDVTETDCPFLNRVSLFDCNRPIIRHIDVLKAKALSGELKIKGQASIEIVEKLRNGIKMSKLVTTRAKKILL